MSIVCLKSKRGTFIQLAKNIYNLKTNPFSMLHTK